MDEHYEDLARYLFAAVTAHRSGLSLRTAYERYARKAKLGPFWYAAAKSLDGAALQQMDALISKALK